MIKLSNMKNRDFIRAVLIAVFVLVSGVIIVTFHSIKTQAFSREIDEVLDNSSIDIQKIRDEISLMSEEEIEKTIKDVEREIIRLNSEIR